MATEEQIEEEDGRNRREHERIRVTRPVKLEATLRGRFIDIMRLEMIGATIDMSDGGFCANVDQSISPGVRCRVEINDDDGKPRSLWGRVRRTTGGKNGYVVALEFDEPLVAAELLAPAGSVKNAADEDASPAGKPAAKKTKRKSKAKS